MTDLDLQLAIMREIRELTDSHGLKKLDGTDWKDYNLYRQEKPYKYDDSYEDGELTAEDGTVVDRATLDQEDYIIVMIDDEDTNESGEWLVTMHIILSIMLLEDQHQGNLILADLMNQIDLHFAKLGLLDGKYEVQKKNKHKRFNQECYPNYYESDYITQWKLPRCEMEGLEDLV